MGKFKNEVNKVTGDKMAFDNRNRGNDEINEIISKINNFEKLADITVKEYADEGGFADIVAKNSIKLKTNQLRKFFGAVRLMEQKETWEEIEPEFYLLKPRLAVSAGRKNIPKDFYNLIMITMRKVDVGSDEDKLKGFKNFVGFFESIVAYHKFYEETRGFN